MANVKLTPAKFVKELKRLHMIKEEHKDYVQKYNLFQDEVVDSDNEEYWREVIRGDMAKFYA